MNFSQKLFFLTAVLFFHHAAVFGFDVVIINSKDIIPYNESIQGIQQNLDKYPVEVFNIEEDMDRGKSFIDRNINRPGSLFIGVGPQAAFLLSKEKRLPHRIFSMVLNPETLFGPDNLYPGVSLNIPVAFQLEKIRKAFPDRSTVGVFYWPGFNQKNIDTIVAEAKKRNIDMKPFTISSASEIPGIIQSEKFQIDALLVIPDIRLEDTRIIEFIIRECLKRKIPVIGYNKWFARNGAVLSFFIDYRDIGIQAGNLSISLMGTEDHRLAKKISPPETVGISINLKTARRLGVEVSSDIIDAAGEVIR